LDEPFFFLSFFFSATLMAQSSPSRLEEITVSDGRLGGLCTSPNSHGVVDTMALSSKAIEFRETRQENSSESTGVKHDK
jgi:hypothetical protein